MDILGLLIALFGLIGVLYYFPVLGFLLLIVIGLAILDNN